MYSPEATSRLEILRHKSSTEGLSAEEQREVLVILRQGRALATSQVAKSKAAKAKPDGAAVLANLFAALEKGKAS